MSEPIVAPHPQGKTPGIRPVLPSQSCDTENCEMALQIGVFFDGTGNNMYLDQPSQSDSNVARLFRAYPDKWEEGLYPVYVPGLGTPFPDIGEAKGLRTGAGFAAGGDGRINYGLLFVLNAIHRAVSSNQPLFTVDTIQALCRNGKRQFNAKYGYAPLPGNDAAALQKIGMSTSGGLLRGNGAGDTQRTAFLNTWSAKIAERVRNPKVKPRLKEISLDVFGFSRGAAEARVFCTWLLQAMPGGKLCGVPATIRFLGIFDSVASVGWPHSALGGDWTDGHLDWASAANLQIPSEVKNCVHYMAMHENRAAFPVDSVRRPGGALPGNCKEYMSPGMHSDVGGGYSPKSQGRGPDALDSQKLSQVPLGLMYNAARDAQVPVNRSIAGRGASDPFVIDAKLLTAHSDFMRQCGGPKPIRDWLLPYLAFRYQYRSNYPYQDFQFRASKKDMDDLLGANKTLIADIEALEATDTLGKKVADAVIGGISQGALGHGREVAKLAPEAREILRRMKEYPSFLSLNQSAMAHLFINYAHDSYAGFRPYDELTAWGWDYIPGSWEPQGYLHYRRYYHGDNNALAQLSPTEDSSAQVA